MMHPYIYVFDSYTANEAATAVKTGQCESIIQYHTNKHQQPPMMGDAAAAPPPPQQHAPPPGSMSPQKMQERASKLNRLGQLALTIQPSQPPAPAITPQQQPPPPASTSAPPPPSQQSSQLDPIAQMTAMAEASIDNYGHTVHHHPN